MQSTLPSLELGYESFVALCWNQMGVGRNLVPVLAVKMHADLKLNKWQLKSNTVLRHPEPQHCIKSWTKEVFET